MTNKAKRVLSFGVVSLSLFAGLFGCARAPGAIFVIGVNDSAPEILALLLPVTLLPASVIALWKRRLIGLWCLLLGAIWIYGMGWQSHYMRSVRHFSGHSVQDLFLKEFLPAYFVLSIGTCLLATQQAGWPEMLGGDREGMK